MMGLRQTLLLDRDGEENPPSLKAMESSAIHYEDASLFRAGRLQRRGRDGFRGFPGVLLFWITTPFLENGAIP